MNIVTINGNTKKDGFINGALSVVTSYLEKNGAEVLHVRLHEADIKDCIGCFNCLKTGACVQNDDMAGIVDAMIKADGFVIGSPVRNGLVTACYKRFYERITYMLGFPLLLEDKYTLAISSVGYIGGKNVNRRFLGLQDVFRTRLSDFIFCKVGIPARIKPEDMRTRLEYGAKKLISDINNRPGRPFFKSILFAIDRMFMKKYMFEKNPELYRNVIKCWQKKGYM